jgi:hypothetical protein
MTMQLSDWKNNLDVCDVDVWHIHHHLCRCYGSDDRLVCRWRDCMLDLFRFPSRYMAGVLTSEEEQLRYHDKYEKTLSSLSFLPALHHRNLTQDEMLMFGRWSDRVEDMLSAMYQDFIASPVASIALYLLGRLVRGRDILCALPLQKMPLADEDLPLL